MPTIFDLIDRKILRALQRNAKIANTKLADIAGLSPSPCLRRVKILEEAGAIDRYVALLNPAALGLGMTIFVRIALEKQDQEAIENFAAAIRKLPQVVEAYLMAGEYDFLVRVVVSDLDDYRTVHMGHFATIRGVRNVVSEIPLQTIKQTTELPI
jgi:Lrp/AsnC family leucine-responsive transcriptional regulator